MLPCHRHKRQAPEPASKPARMFSSPAKYFRNHELYKERVVIISKIITNPQPQIYSLHTILVVARFRFEVQLNAQADPRLIYVQEEIRLRDDHVRLEDWHVRNIRASQI